MIKGYEKTAVFLVVVKSCKKRAFYYMGRKISKLFIMGDGYGGWFS